MPSQHDPVRLCRHLRLREDGQILRLLAEGYRQLVEVKGVDHRPLRRELMPRR